MATYYDLETVTAVPNEIFIILTVLFTVLGLVSFVMITEHIIDAVALMRLGKKLNVKNSWLAWIPVGDKYVVGSLAAVSDEKKGRVRKWGKILPVWYLIGIVGLIIAVSCFTVYMCGLISMEEMGAEASVMILPVFVLCYIFIILASLFISIASTLNLICVFKIFEHLNAKKAIKYIILSVLVPFADAILLLKCEKELVCEEKEVLLEEE